jgi:hypothetical protein
VNDNMLAAALAVPVAECIVSASETLRIRQIRYQAGDLPYPAWYLFGCSQKNVTGLVAQYQKICNNVFLCPESLITADLTADFLDAQLCTLSESLVCELIKQGKKISGYLPESMSLKSAQADLFKESGGGRFLPEQQTYSSQSVPLLPNSSAEVWIIKETSGSAGRGRSGNPYTVWLRDKLASQLSEIIANLDRKEEIIISEFLRTDDPYAWHADHVVHKMHYLTDQVKKYVVPHGTVCQKFIHRCDWPRLNEAGSLQLSEFIGEPHFATGTVDTIKAIEDFSNILTAYKGRLMLSVDFIIPTDGVPRFLEANKLAATFAERFDPHLPAPVDAYAALPLTTN